MATIQLRRKTSAGNGPLTGVGTIKQGEPLIDLNGGNLYVAKLNKSGTSASPITANDYLEFVSKNNLMGVINSQIGSLNLGTASKYNVGGYGGCVPVIGSDGKLSSSIMPQIALTNTFVCASQADMLKQSSAEIGDICIRTDINKTFILKQGSYSTLANWEELRTPSDKVQSVNGKTGAVNISLSELGGVSNGTFNAHKSDNTHLTATQRNALANMYNTDIKSGTSCPSVSSVASSVDINNRCIAGGLLINYTVSTGYNPSIKEIRMGIDASKVLTPNSVIDGGTF